MEQRELKVDKNLIIKTQKEKKKLKQLQSAVAAGVRGKRVIEVIN